MTKKTAKKEQTPPHEYIILEDGCMLDIFDVQTRIEEISTLWDNKVENEQAVNIIKHIKKIERITAVLNKQRDFMCSILCKRMKAKRRKIWEVADGVFVTYVEGMNSVRIDKRMLKDEYPEVYKEVARNVEMKEYIQLFMTESASEDYQ